MTFKLTFGRFKIWVSSKKDTVKLFNWLYVFWLIPKKKDPLRYIQGTFHSFHTRKQFKQERKNIIWEKIDDGFVTYQIRRLCLTVHTPKFHQNNPWKE